MSDTESDPTPEVRWRGIELDVSDIMSEDLPQFIKNNKIRARYSEDPHKYHHILVIDDTFTAYVPDPEGELSMAEFKTLKQNNTYL